MIYNFKTFLLEHSKYDPIPELSWDKHGKTAIILMGIPGSGKSTFTKQFLIPKLKDYKIFDPDELMVKLQKIGKEPVKKSPDEKSKKFDDIKNVIKTINTAHNIPLELEDEEIRDIIDNNLYIDGAADILFKRLTKFAENNKHSDLIFDTTGNDYDKIGQVVELLRFSDYKIIFIKIRASIETVIKSNMGRYRKAQPDYQMQSVERSESLEREYLNLEPDAYYIYERDINALFKFIDGDIRVTKEELI